jgi:hypothetical protein
MAFLLLAFYISLQYEAAEVRYDTKIKKCNVPLRKAGNKFERGILPYL